MAKRVVFVLAILELVAAGLMTASQAATTAAASSQVESKAPVFEVAAIKASDPAARNDCFMKGQPGGQTFVGRCITLRLLIKYSYKIIDSQIAGGPDWLDTEFYDFEAKADRSVTRAEVASLFQTVLADRFKLKFREPGVRPISFRHLEGSGL